MGNFLKNVICALTRELRARLFCKKHLETVKLVAGENVIWHLI